MFACSRLVCAVATPLCAFVDDVCAWSIACWYFVAFAACSLLRVRDALLRGRHRLRRGRDRHRVRARSTAVSPRFKAASAACADASDAFADSSDVALLRVVDLRQRLALRDMLTGLDVDRRDLARLLERQRQAVGASTLPVDVTLSNTVPRFAVASVCVVADELDVDRTVANVAPPITTRTTTSAPLSITRRLTSAPDRRRRSAVAALRAGNSTWHVLLAAANFGSDCRLRSPPGFAAPFAPLGRSGTFTP